MCHPGCVLRYFLMYTACTLSHNTHGLPVGLWPRAEKGFFGGDQAYAYPPVAFAPNPVECLWVGPNVSNFECVTCVLGYETVSSDDTTCRKPNFKPNKEWENSSAKADLKLSDTRGTVVKPSKDTGRPKILKGHTCVHYLHFQLHITAKL